MRFHLQNYQDVYTAGHLFPPRHPPTHTTLGREKHIILGISRFPCEKDFFEKKNAMRKDFFVLTIKRMNILK